MSTITVWMFDTPHGADDALGKLEKRTSALFALTSDEVFDTVAEDLRGMKPGLIRTNLSREQESRLREAFAEEG